MTATIRFSAALAAFCAAVVLTAPAIAQTAQVSPPTASALSEKERLGVEIWRTMFKAMDFQGMVLKGVGSLDAKLCPEGSPPRCRELVRESMIEVLEPRIARLEVALGRELADGLTEAELRAGLAFLSRPDIIAAASTYAARPEGEGTSAEVDAESDKFEATPEGRAFAARIDQIDLKRAGDEVMADVGEQFIERFQAKFDAEASRARPD